MVIVTLSSSEFSGSTIEASSGTLILLSQQIRLLASGLSTLEELSRQASPL